MKRAGSDDALRCSFCHKSQDVVGKLISSPSDYPRAYICDECIAVCNSILEDDKAEALRPDPNKIPKPLEVKEFLDQYVIGQEATKKKLAVAVYNHCKRIHMNRMRNYRGRAAEVQYPADRAHRHRQDPDGADAGARSWTCRSPSSTPPR